MQSADNSNSEPKGSPEASPVNQTSNATRPPPVKLEPKPLNLEPAPVSQPLPQGYNNDPAASTIAPAPGLDADLSIHPTLRSPGFAPTATMMPSGVPAPPEHTGVIPGPPNPSVIPAPPPGLEDGRKAKRELSQSKRAAQNRAAQRAFRQRKEGYIKKLEQQVRDYNDMEQRFRQIENENYACREYIGHLRSRLLDAQIEPPQPPPHINLAFGQGAPGPASYDMPDAPPQQHEGELPAEPTPNTGSVAGAASLDAVAQAVQSLSRSEAGFKPDADDSQEAEDARTAEEITRQLSQAEPVPAANM